VNHLSSVVLAIPAIGAAIIATAALRPRRENSNDDGLPVAPSHADPTENESEAAVFRRIAGIFAVFALAAVVGLSLFGRISKLDVSLGGNECSAAFALLTTAVWLPVIYVARRSDHQRPALFYGLLLLLEASYLAIFAFDNVVWLCAALEVNSVLLYLLTAGWGQGASEGLAKKMLLMNLAADLTILIGLLGIMIASARVSGSENTASVHLTYSLSEIVQEFPRQTTDEVASQEYWKHAQRSLLAILVLGATIKAPLVPFHAWFSAVVAEGPLCVGLALIGPGLRVSLYLLARFIGPLCGDLGWAELIVGLTVLGALHESLLAYGQANLKRMVASVCLLQASLAFAGFFSMRPENASGPLMLAIASGVAGVLMMFAIGFLELGFSTDDLTNVGGIVHKLPNLAAVLLIAAFSLLGLPGLFGFPGLFATLGAVFGAEVLFALLAIGACLIGSWALISLLQRLVLGTLRLPLPGEGNVLLDRGFVGDAPGGPSVVVSPDSNTSASAREWWVVADGRGGSIDLGSRELLILGPLLASLVACGIWPQVISAALRSALILSPLSP
jgi:NADH-quinone oxidoreductase subunit M